MTDIPNYDQELEQRREPAVVNEAEPPHYIKEIDE